MADVLEAEWNAKLRALAEAREAAEQHRLQDQADVSTTERATMLDLPRDFTHFWRDPRTTDRERKRVVRLLIDDVTVQKTDHIVAHIRFKGGATRTLTVSLPPPFTQSRLTPPETLTAIDQLLNTSTDAEVAAQLNARGYCTFAGLPFQATHVSQLRRAHGVQDRWTRLREAGLQTAEEIAADLGVRAQTVWHWYHRGWIMGVRYNDRGTCLFVPPETVPARSRRRRVRPLEIP